MPHAKLSLAFAMFVALLAQDALAQVHVRDAWVRGTVPGQKSTGVYLKLESTAATALVGVSSPLARRAEVHEMAMDGNVMRMRAVTELAIAPGRPVELRPGGFHLMLLDLQRPLAEGDSVPLVLTFRDAQGRTSAVETSARVRAPGARDGGDAAHEHAH